MINGHCDEKFSELKKILEQQLNSDFELVLPLLLNGKAKRLLIFMAATKMKIKFKME